jgi:restriction system protein
MKIKLFKSRTKKKIKRYLLLSLLLLILLSDRSVQSMILELINISIIPILIASLIFIIIKVVKKTKKLKAAEKLRGSDINTIDKMDGVSFENYLGGLFQELGYKTEVTKTSGDQGADLLLFKDRRKIAVQAKRYKGNVGNTAVQEVYTAMNYYKAGEAWVVTNSYFTPAAKELAQVNKVRLIDRDELISLTYSINKRSNI